MLRNALPTQPLAFYRAMEKSEKAIQARRFLVRGRVQGVGYRWFVEREAHILGIAAVYLINPILFAALVGAHYQMYIPAVALGMSLLIMIVVLVMFLAIRNALGGGPSQR